MPQKNTLTDAMKGGGQTHFAYLYAADACRMAGKYRQAIDYYQQVLAVPNPDQDKGQVARCYERAEASLEAIKLFEFSDVKQVSYGTYRADLIGYEAPIHVEAVVQSGRIESVRITQHTEKQFYSAMPTRPPKSSPSKASKASMPSPAPPSPAKPSSTPPPKPSPAVPNEP